MSKPDDELDISASFEVGGIKGEDLIAAVERLAGGDFVKRLIRANDAGEWYQIGRGSMYSDCQCVILGDGEPIKEGATYTLITVRYQKISAHDGMVYSVGIHDFPASVSKQVRIFRDKLREELACFKESQKSK